MASPTLLRVIFCYFVWLMSSSESLVENNQCPSSCSCLGKFVDCSRRDLLVVPKDLPNWTDHLDLQNNAITSLTKESFQDLERLYKLELSANKLKDDATIILRNLTFLTKLKLNKNRLSEVPVLSGLVNLSCLSLSHNEIRTVNGKALENLHNLKTLDLNNNHILEIKADSFPTGSNIQNLYLNNNHISSFENGSLDNLAALIELKLNRNQLARFHKDLFKHLKDLKILELNKNKFTRIEGLSFSGLDGLHTLKLQRNSINILQDGAFWGLKNLSQLQLDYNNITSVTKSWLYGLDSLQQLSLCHNRISSIEQGGWDSCKQLVNLDLSNNKLSAIKTETFEHLSKLRCLYLNNNLIEYIAEGAFNSTPALEVLELNNNKISWTIEDMNGAFLGLSHLMKFGLASNQIKTLNKKAFIGLEKMKTLDLTNNNITSVQDNAFAPMPHLTELFLNTTSLLCDCSLKWFPSWLNRTTFSTLIAVCSYPDWLKGKSVLEVPLANFTCDEFPKPHLIEHPKTGIALKGDNITLHCKASSSSSLPMTFLWKKDNLYLKSANVRQFVRSSDGKGTEQSSELILANITQSDAGKYQCVVSNHFGTAYSSRSKLSVLIYPTFAKIPVNVTVKSGSTARLECAASGSPHPQIAWQKDGGNDFPAARERRMHVMPTDDVFFIINIKAADMGVYSCTAQNLAGSIVANASLTVLESPSFVKQMESKEIAAGEPIVLECMAAGSPKPTLVWRKDGGSLITTERHFFTADDQLLIIVDTTMADAGKYECEMSNPLGTEKGYSQLTVIPAMGSVVNESDMTGIIIITVVCCAVATSIVWVVIIYQTRKRMGLVEVGSATCQYPRTLLPSNLSSAPHLYMDTNSEHSSGKDSGTGDSAKRSSDDLLLGNGLSVNLEGGSSHSMEATNHLLPKETSVAVEAAAAPPVLRSLNPRRTDHDRLCKASLLCENCSQRWSAPQCVEFHPGPVPPSCSYHSLPINLRTGLIQDNASQLEVVEGSQNVDEATPCVANV
ncbi:leucine-rich repeats and immunoglobulin-like domains protein 3 isoform X1 [Anabrus simplex]|uniref:leucine-rich repeats and immunoglobulin-like domains protein 3 isoform X1 n=1 Tax=Anabrus simplex TaxID=316456 RepID=UPI0035A38E07